MKPEPDIRVVGIPSYEVAAAWPHVVDMLAPSIAFSHGAYEPDDIKAGCEAKDSQLWVVVVDGVPTAAGVSAIINYPRLKALAVPFIGGGDLRVWWPAFRNRLVQFAKSHGCKRIEGGGRKGWAKIMAGMEVRGYFLQMEI